MRFARPTFDADGWLRGVRRVESPNAGARPADTAVDLVVLHSISLPPGEYGGDAIERLFTNRLDCDAHPYFQQLRGLRVSAGSDPDTVYVGYSRADHWSATTNYWNLWTGTRRPGTANANNATWDFDDTSILAAHGVGEDEFFEVY